MAKRGPKPQPADVVQMRGTARNSRARDQVVESIFGEPVRPTWLTGLARKIWAKKVEIYKERGQNVVGCEDALAQYCRLEAEIIDFYKRKLTPPVAMINAHRVYAGEFFDTPASQHQAVGKKGGKDNPFNRNGRKPAD